jgi:hypothetical protein
MVVHGYDLNTEAFIQELFKSESTIRYVAIVDTEYNVLASKQREGIRSLTTEEAARNFVSIVPQIIVESVDKLSPFLGRVAGITAHYQNALVVFYSFENLIVIISFQPEQETPFYDRITRTFGKLSEQYLT